MNTNNNRNKFLFAKVFNVFTQKHPNLYPKLLRTANFDAKSENFKM